MPNSDRIRIEAEAIQSIRTTEGLSVIMSEIERRINSLYQSVNSDDPNWTIKMAQRDGKISALREIRTWVDGRLTKKPKSVPPTEA